MKEDDAFYMAVENPREFRKELLGASKDIIKLIQKYEFIKELRAEKIKKMYEFSDSLGEISLIMSKLKKTTPATRLRKLNVKYVKKEKAERKHSKPKKKRSSNEVEKLQEELELIEQKLDNLGQQ